VPPPPHRVNAAGARVASHLTSETRNREEEEEHRHRRREGTEGHCCRKEGGARLREGGEGVSPKGAEGAPSDDARHRTTVKEGRAAVMATRHSRLALVAMPLQGSTDAGGRTATRFGWHSRPRPSLVRSALEAVPPLGPLANARDPERWRGGVAPGGRSGAWPLAIFIPCVSISHLLVVDGVFRYTKHVHYTLVWT
jgi:hypothetical protein